MRGCSDVQPVALIFVRGLVKETRKIAVTTLSVRSNRIAKKVCSPDLSVTAHRWHSNVT